MALSIATRALLASLLATTTALIPLDVVSVTPSTDSAAVVSPDAPCTQRSSCDALTVTFSRAVIALGSDFGPARCAQPHALRPRPAGRRSPAVGDHPIARFDVMKVVPPELELTLSLNPSLATYDGAKFATSSQPRQFTTPQLRISSARVRSKPRCA